MFADKNLRPWVVLDLDAFRIRNAKSPNEQPITEQDKAAEAWTLLDLDRFRIGDANSPSEQGARQGTVDDQGAGQETFDDQGAGQETFHDMPPLEYSSLSSGNDLFSTISPSYQVYSVRNKALS